MRRVVDRRRLAQVAAPGDREADRAGRFVNQQVVDREARTVVVGVAATGQRTAVVNNGAGRRRRRAEDAVHRVADGNREVFADFVDGVVGDGDGDGLLRFTGGKVERAGLRYVVRSCRRRAVGRREVNARGDFGGAALAHREGHRALLFIDDDVRADGEYRPVVVGRGARGEQAPVVDDGRDLRAVADRRVAGVAQRNAEVLRAFVNGVVGDVDRDGLDRLASRKVERPRRRVIVFASQRRAIDRAEVDRRGQVGGAYLGHREGRRPRRFVNHEVSAQVEDRTVVVGRGARRQRPPIVHNGANAHAVHNDRTDRIRQVEGEALRAFEDAVVGDGYRDGLAGHPGRKGERARGDRVVGTNRRAVLRRVVDRRRLAQVAAPGDREADRAGRFVNQQVVDREARTVVVGVAATGQRTAVVNNGAGRRRRRAEDAVHRVADGNREVFADFVDGVVGDGDGDGLLRFTGGKVERAGLRYVVRSCRRRAVGRREVNARGDFGGAALAHREGHRALLFIDDDVRADGEYRPVVVGRGARGEQAPVVDDGRDLRAVADRRVAGVAQRNAEVLRAFVNGVVGDVDRDGLDRLASRKVERPRRRVIVFASQRRAIDRAEVDRRGQVGGAYLGHREGRRPRRFVNHEVSAQVEDRTVVVGRGARREQSPVIDDGRHLGGIPYGRIDRGTQLQTKELRTLEDSIINQHHGNRFNCFARGKTEKATDWRVIASSLGCAIYSAIANACRLINRPTTGNRKGNGARCFVHHEITTDIQNRNVTRNLGGTFDRIQRPTAIGAKLIRQRINRFNNTQQFYKGMPFVPGLNHTSSRRLFVEQSIEFTTGFECRSEFLEVPLVVGNRTVRRIRLDLGSHLRIQLGRLSGANGQFTTIGQCKYHFRSAGGNNAFAFPNFIA